MLRSYSFSTGAIASGPANTVGIMRRGNTVLKEVHSFFAVVFFWFSHLSLQYKATKAPPPLFFSLYCRIDTCSLTIYKGAGGWVGPKSYDSTKAWYSFFLLFHEVIKLKLYGCIHAFMYISLYTCVHECKYIYIYVSFAPPCTEGSAKISAKISAKRTTMAEHTHTDRTFFCL